jgi:hypothetical protein
VKGRFFKHPSELFTRNRPQCSSVLRRRCRANSRTRMSQYGGNHLQLLRSTVMVLLHFIYGVNYASAQIQEQPVSKSNFVRSSVIKGSSEEEKVKKIKEREDQHQNNKLESNKIIENNKPHYILNLNIGEANKQQAYINALNQFARIENFRLIDKRSIIQLANGDGKIELFSSTELNQLYGRRIRPQNLKEESAKPDIEFILNEYGVIKEQLKK